RQGHRPIWAMEMVVDGTLNGFTAGLLLLADRLSVVDATRWCRGKRLGGDPFPGVHPSPTKGWGLLFFCHNEVASSTARFLNSFFLFPRARARERRRALFHAGLRAVSCPFQFCLFSGLLCLFSG